MNREFLSAVVRAFLAGVITLTIAAGAFYKIGLAVSPYTPKPEYTAIDMVVSGVLAVGALCIAVLIIIWVGAGVLELIRRIKEVTD